MSRTVAEREDRGRADEFRVASELCLVGENAEIDYGENLMWVLAGLRDEEHDSCEESLDAFLLCDELKKAINQMFLNPPEEIKTSILDTFEKEPPILCVKK